MSSKREKLAIAGLALTLTLIALALITSGSFLPHWAVMRNSSQHGNVSFSLWTRRECFLNVCRTDHVVARALNEICWQDPNTKQEICRMNNSTRMISITKCWEANYCNSSWVGGGDMENTPSMLIVAKAFEIPAIFFGVVCIVLFVIKIVLLIKRPGVKRLHLKAAYLTFGAIAGVVAIVGVILFMTMLEGDKYQRQWAPFVNLAGGILFFLFGFGGYLRWRDRTSGDDFEDDMSLYERDMHEIRAVNRQTSETNPKAAEAQL